MARSSKPEISFLGHEKPKATLIKCPDSQYNIPSSVTKIDIYNTQKQACRIEMTSILITYKSNLVINN